MNYTIHKSTKKVIDALLRINKFFIFNENLDNLIIIKVKNNKGKIILGKLNVIKTLKSFGTPAVPKHDK